MEEGTTVQARPLARGTLRLQSDERLLKLFRRGVEPAFDELVRRYREALVGYAGSIAGRDRAEDVVQDSLVKAHRSLAADRDIDPRPWLYAVVRNTALNDIRDNRKHRHDDLGDSAGFGASPGDLVEQRERFAAVLAAVADLPPAQRRALVDHELSGFSHEEIAAELDLSTGATKQLIYRARISLRNAFGAMIPLPLIAWLVEGSGMVATGAAGGGATATGVIGSLGGGGAAKLAVVAVVAGGSLAGGIAAEKQRSEKNPDDQKTIKVQTGSIAGGPVDASGTRTVLAGSEEAKVPERRSERKTRYGNREVNRHEGNGTGDLDARDSSDSRSGSTGNDRPGAQSDTSGRRPERGEDGGHSGSGFRPDRSHHGSGSSVSEDDFESSGPGPGPRPDGDGAYRPSGGDSGGHHIGESGGESGSPDGSFTPHEGGDSSGSGGGSDDSGFDD